MPRVIHFEIHAENPQRAIDFYSKLFGWQFTQWGGEQYWLIKTGESTEPGIDGGLLPRRGTIDGTAVIAYVCTVDSKNLDATLEQAISLGGQIALPKMPVPGVGWLAYAKDPEGNIFGVMQSDPSAK
jgi:predicted enzyme related to lactoylglutathione lyase